jgi:uncharacterized membrane protein YbhN (UPF0104 family)
MKIINRALFLFLVFGAVIGIILYYQGIPIFNTLAQANLSIISIIILLTIPYNALGGYGFSILSRPYNIHIHWMDWMGLSFIASFINQFLPYRPGLAVRFVYLQKHYKMTFSQFSLIMFIYFLLTFFCGLLFFSTGFFIPLPHEFYKIFYISTGILLVTFLIYVLLKKRFNLHNFMKHPFVLLSALFVFFVIQLIAAGCLYFAFDALHYSFSFFNCIFLTGLLCIAMIFPITPGNIGVLETLLGTLTHLMVNDFTIGFSAMALLRASQWIVVVILGIYFSIKLMGKLIPPLSKLSRINDKKNNFV